MAGLRSSKDRLVLCAGAVTLALGAALATAVHGFARAELREDLEDLAHREALEVASLTADVVDRQELGALRDRLERLRSASAMRSLEVWSLGGDPLLWLPSGGAPTPWPTGFAEARRGAIAYGALGPPAALRCALRVDYAREPRWLVSVTVGAQETERSLARVDRILAAGLALLSLAALAGSRGLLTVGLRPVASLAEAARRLEAQPEGKVEAAAQEPELAALARTLNRLLERARALEGRLERCVRVVSQTLRAPLSRLRDEAELALANGHPRVLEEALRSLRDELEEQRDLVDALLELARGESPGPELELEPPIDLVELARDVLQQARARGEDRGVAVEARLAPAGLPVRGSRASIQRALRALLDDALERGGPDLTRVEVVLRGEADLAVVEVRHDGPAVSPAEGERLFEPFGREPREAAPRGHGLGLAVSRCIARRHGGDLVYHSAETGGGHLVLGLPLAPGEVA